MNSWLVEELARAKAHAIREREALEIEIRMGRRRVARLQTLAAFALAFSVGFNLGRGSWCVAAPTMLFIPFWLWAMRWAERPR